MKIGDINGFTWDARNIGKVRVHGLEPEDIEEVFDEDPFIFQHPSHDERWVALGFPPEPDERFIYVSFEVEEETQWVRVVTAFEPTSEKFWRLYAKAKKIEP